jgi:hypothetical protein
VVITTRAAGKKRAPTGIEVVGVVVVREEDGVDGSDVASRDRGAGHLS